MRIGPRDRDSGSGRGRRPSRRARPELAELEPRQLLAAPAPTPPPAAIEPTAEEQYMLQLVNRARSDPAQETRRLLAVARTDPAVRQMVRRWPLDRFAAAMSGYGPLPPLAFNPRLIEAARDRNETILATNDQRHAADGFLTDAAVARADDGAAYYEVGAGAWSWGENLFAFSKNVRADALSDYVDYFHAGLMIDWGNPDFGHLRNLLAPGPGGASAGGHRPYREIGIGLRTGAVPTVPPPADPANPLNRGLGVGPVLVAQEFGYREGPAFLAGAVYRDADGDRFYTPGEGLGGALVTAVGRAGEGTFTATTWASGGYTLPLPAGSYAVTIAAAGAAPRTREVRIDVDNVGWDVDTADPTPDGGPAAPAAPRARPIRGRAPRPRVAPRRLAPAAGTPASASATAIAPVPQPPPLARGAG
jgi:hypothetical protein